MSNTKTIKFELDGRELEVPAGSTIYDAARLHDVDIPVLCHKEDSKDEFKSVGVCRVCCVMEGTPRLPNQVPKRFIAACCRKVEEGMEILTEPEPVRVARRTLIELLLSEHTVPCAKHSAYHSCELELLGERYGLLKSKVDSSKTAGEPGRYITEWAVHKTYDEGRSFDKGVDRSNPSIIVDHGSCILCDRCVRACNDVAENNVIGRAGKGVQSFITFDDGADMGRSSCVNCGWCMVACPTGALTYGFGTQPKMKDGATLTAAEMKAHPFWNEVSIEFLRRAEGGVVVRQFDKGDVICRQGDYGSTAFYIDSGEVEIFLEDAQGHVRTHRSSGGLIKKVTSLLRSKTTHARPGGEDVRKFIPIDADVDLDAMTPVAKLGHGELFGEASCINNQPRSATVRATKPTIVLEMMRNVLDILRRQKKFRARTDAKYREYALDNHLRTSELFADVPLKIIDYLRPRVGLVAYEPGDVIFNQNEPADALYLVRMGHVKVVETFADGGSTTLAYLSRGEVFGEIGLVSGDNVRTATCSALDHVELVRVARADFDFLREAHPPLDARVHAIAEERIRANRQHATSQRSVTLQQYVEQGLYEAQSLLVLDLERCTRCDECVRACAQAHNGVSRLLREGLRFDKYLVTTSCRSCKDPLCMIGCPVGAIHRRPGSNEILIADHCIGCGLCAEQCPYGNIAMHPFGDLSEEALAIGRGPGFKATVCDLCTDQCLDEGDEPSCVYACPHDAAHRVTGTELFDHLLPSITAKAAKMPAAVAVHGAERKRGDDVGSSTTTSKRKGEG